MNIESYLDNAIYIVSLKGRFDAFETPQFAKWLEAYVTSDQKHVVVDLGGVEFIDSSGLAALVKGLKRCRELGGEQLLCNLQQSVVIIFELTRLDKAFKIFDTVPKAIAEIRQL